MALPGDATDLRHLAGLQATCQQQVAGPRYYARPILIPTVVLMAEYGATGYADAESGADGGYGATGYADVGSGTDGGYGATRTDTDSGTDGGYGATRTGYALNSEGDGIVNLPEFDLVQQHLLPRSTLPRAVLLSGLCCCTSPTCERYCLGGCAATTRRSILGPVLTAGTVGFLGSVPPAVLVGYNGGGGRVQRKHGQG
eukprot:364234-Rhodomonas_salina.1